MANNKDFKVKNGIQPTVYHEGLGTVVSESVGYSLAGASYDSVSFSVTAQELSPSDISFKSDGTKMYVIGASGDDINQYTLSTAWDLSTASFDSVTFSVSSQEVVPNALFIKPDGTTFWVAGNENDTVYQYSMSTAWDMSTASYDSVSFSVAAQGTYPVGIWFKTDGTEMYVADLAGVEVNQYTLSTAWDITTASFTTNLSVSSEDTGTNSVVFNSSGTSMFVSGITNDAVFEYTLSTAWDLSTASYSGNSLDVSSQADYPSGIYFKSDGSKMYVSNYGTGDTIYQYSTVQTTNTLDLSTGSVFDLTPTSDIQINLSNPADSGTVSQATLLLTGEEATGVASTFSTTLYTGNGSTQTITNGIDLANDGGLVWIKNRDAAYDHKLYDTERGATYSLATNTTNSAITTTNGLTSFNSDGFAVGSGPWVNNSNQGIASWTFRKAPKFFDVVKYNSTSGNTTNFGSAGATVDHNLGSVPGMIIVKCTDTSATNWKVYHRGLNGGTTPEQYEIELNQTGAEANSATSWNDTAPTSTQFTLGASGDVNNGSRSYIAYLFAHNDGDGEFGPDGDADIIKCGSYTGNDGTQDIDLGFEPAWVLVKSSSNTRDWKIIDNMRGFAASPNNKWLTPNSSNSEENINASASTIEPTATGFRLTAGDAETNSLGWSYIYIAIRRGPMAVPESATDVFAMDTLGGTLPNPPAFNSGFTVDAGLYKVINSSSSWSLSSRLTQGKRLSTDSTAAEASESAQTFDFMDGYYNATSVSTNYQSWMWKRAPNYFDVVAYTGNGTAGRTVSHNLGVAPEMMWVKVRSQSYGWITYHESLGNTKYMTLDDTTAAATYSQNWNNTDPTATEFTLGTNWNVNKSGETFIAYLFASLDGVSKVGTFTHTDGTPTDVDCGFTSGARFVIWKKTSNIGQWVVVDTERGIVAGNDPYLELNSTNAESSAYDIIDPLSSGFTVGSVMSSGTYIFYAIA